MILYTIQIRSASPNLPELVCTYQDLAYITNILDQSDPCIVFEYKISSVGGCVYSADYFPFPCEKLVTEFNWNKSYIPPSALPSESKKDTQGEVATTSGTS